MMPVPCYIRVREGTGAHMAESFLQLIIDEGKYISLTSDIYSIVVH
jgi:hypothetical protein